MNGSRRHPRAPDPLRSARRAVHADRFQDAWGELDRLSGSIRQSAEWLLLAAMASWRLGAFERSRAAALQARDRYRAGGDIDGTMRSENVAGAGALAIGDLDDATRRFTRALTLADRLHDDLMTGRCANNLGNVEYYRTRYASALGFYRLAIATFDKLSALSGLAEAWLNAAIVTREQGDFAASRSAGERAVNSAERAGNERLFGQALAAYAETTLARGDLALARAQVERALVIARKQDDPLGEADALRILALVTMHTDPRVAAETGRTALAVARRVEHPWAIAEVHRALGDIYQHVGEPRRAAEAFHAASIAYRQSGTAERADDMARRSQSLESR